jgi:glycosyltransferase involved in cell wall biosynthesis
MRVMFHSPFATADAKAASGASRMAVLFRRALELGGASVICPALPLTRDGAGDPEAQVRLKACAEEAGRDLLAMIADGRMPRPDAWFSYHVYYKAPDWIGPVVSAALGVPYIVAEGSHAPKRAQGPWRLGHEGASRALASARVLLAMTAFDRHCLEQLAPGRVHDFKPFIDTTPFEQRTAPRDFGGRLLSVGMMRDDRKRESFRLVAEVMRRLPASEFTLSIAGDGKLRREIEALFRDVGDPARVRFLGALPHGAIVELMRGSDLFLWPGIGEAYGLTYLEAQACGLPVVGCQNRGVVDVLRDGETAVLCAPGDADCLASAVLALGREPDRWRDMGLRARDFVHQERSLKTASAHLMRLLEAVM